MQNLRTKSAIVIGTSGVAAAIFVAAMIAAPRSAMANPDMAKSTGKPCGACHTTPPTLNDYGKKFRDSQKK
jgi:cytochrome c553